MIGIMDDKARLNQAAPSRSRTSVIKGELWSDEREQMAQRHSKFNYGNTDLSIRILDEVMRRENEEGPGKATVHLVLNHNWTASGKPYLFAPKLIVYVPYCTVGQIAD
jgi:hypothetical protein